MFTNRRIPTILALLLFLGLSWMTPGHAQEVVARVEVEDPDLEEFVLRATVPIPPEVYPRDDGMIPFGVRDSSGKIVPTQVEIVSRYADPAQGADVVEILARVRRPDGLAAGSPVTYDVVDRVQPPQEFVATPLIGNVFGKPGVLFLAARDVFGNIYYLDLVAGSASSTILRHGPTALQLRTYGEMTPLVENPSALARLLGVHAYITAYAGENALSIDLRLHNGSIGADPAQPTPLGKVYFDAIYLGVPKGAVLQQSFDDPFFGSTLDLGSTTLFELVGPNSDGTLHMMPPQAQFHRRLVVGPSGEKERARSILEERGLGFARAGTNGVGQPLHSWFNAETARYFPQHSRLPHLDHLGPASIRSDHAAELAELAGLVESGSPSPSEFPVVCGALGWAHPYLVKDGGMTGVGRSRTRWGSPWEG